MEWLPWNSFKCNYPEAGVWACHLLCEGRGEARGATGQQRALESDCLGVQKLQVHIVSQRLQKLVQIWWRQNSGCQA